MKLQKLMAGYTAYTDAQELASARGSHGNVWVTTTSTLPTVTTHVAGVGGGAAANAPTVSVLAPTL